MQYVEAAHPFVARQRIADGVVANVPDVQRAARIRQHFKYVELGLARILFGLKERRVGPSLAPLQFDLVMVVLLFRHSFSGSWGCSEARPFKYNCVRYARAQNRGTSICSPSIIAKCLRLRLASTKPRSIAVAAINESNVRRPSDFAYRLRRSYARRPMGASICSTGHVAMSES